MDEAVLRFDHWRIKLATDYCDKVGMGENEKKILLGDPERVLLLSRAYLDYLNNMEEMYL